MAAKRDGGEGLVTTSTIALATGPHIGRPNRASRVAYHGAWVRSRARQRRSSLEAAKRRGQDRGLLEEKSSRQARILLDPPGHADTIWTMRPSGAESMSDGRAEDAPSDVFREEKVRAKLQTRATPTLPAGVKEQMIPGTHADSDTDKRKHSCTNPLPGHTRDLYGQKSFHVTGP